MSNALRTSNRPANDRFPSYLKDASASDRSRIWYEAARNLFTAMIVADRKVLPIEIDTMKDGLKSCFPNKEDRYDDELPSFRENAQRIHKLLKGPGKRYWLGNQYMKLKDYPDHRALLDKLWKISVCDGTLDEREGQIIDMFAHLWRPI